MDHLWLLVFLGVLVGALGTLIGVGGGFIMVPVLLLMQPSAKADEITAISLFVVFLNSLSGSVAYVRMKRVDIRTALYFGAATIPGAILGALSTRGVDRKQFDFIFGALLMIGAIYLLWKPETESGSNGSPTSRHTKREFTDATGTTHSYFFSMPLGIAISSVVGFISSFLGIGGGIIHVPALNRLLNFPIHIATATSQFILGIMALAGTITHIVDGNLNGRYPIVFALGAGAIVGAQLGARISAMLDGKVIVRILAVTLGLTSLRIIWAAYERWSAGN